KEIFSWCFYDWTNSAFALTVLAGFFPVFFKSYYSAGTDPVTSTARLGVGSTVAGLFIAVLSLLLGALADAGGGKKRFLGVFMVLGAFSTASLFLVAQGAWVVALAVFILGNIGFSCANLFYDALLVDVADEKRMDYVSSMGFSLGYLGCGLLFTLNVFMTVKPDLFGLENAAQAVKVSFLMAAVWWLLFSIPLFLNVKERRLVRHVATSSLVSDTLGRLKKTFTAIVKKKVLLFFLCAYWLYFDGVNTFIRMAVDFGLSIGFTSQALMISLLVVQFVAFPSALGFGYLAQKFGTQRLIVVGVLIYISVSGIGAFFMRTETHFIILAAMTGLAQGGIQALSRSYFGKLIPAAESAEYFGFYNIVGRFAVVGPSLVGVVALVAQSSGAEGALASRLGISSVNVLFISGLIFLLLAETERLKKEKVEEAAVAAGSKLETNSGTV
ncbi:MAG: MFS transporter, partial [Fibrobacterota bacterium]